MFEELTRETSSDTARYFILFISIQGVLLVIDEVVFHRFREMPAWERWGHPVDTFFFLLPFLLGGIFQFRLPSELYVLLCVLSSIIIMKDEWIHAKLISGTESFLHAALFLLHPVTLYWSYQSYIKGHFYLLQLMACLLFLVLIFQGLFWIVIEPRLKLRQGGIKFGSL